MVSARRGEVSVKVDAPPEKVWSLLAQLERMGEWSPECYRVAWLDGARSPATVGATFKGWNRWKLLRWTMTCRVTTADPGRELAWSTMQGDRELVTWRYRLQPRGDGTEVVESFEVHHLPPTARFVEDVVMRGRDRQREQAMQATLERIRDVAESTA